MNAYEIFDSETGETIEADFPIEYWQNLRQLAHDLQESQGGYDALSLVVVMEVNPNALPAGWDSFVTDMMDLLPTSVQSETRQAAALLGRKGGSSKSAAKQAASRENGRKGGRPKNAELEAIIKAEPALQDLFSGKEPV
jgi:hypothetical protein